MPIDIVFETHALTEDNERGIATGWLRSSGCAGLPDWLLGLVVVHDDVGVVSRVRRSEVELLGGDVPLAPAAFDFARR
jgi:hypothetical protein